jgi:DNA replication protein DnaC
VLFSRTGDLGQRLPAARCELALPAALAELDKFDLLVRDDLSHVRQDQAETSGPFELILERYERRSPLITADRPFAAWDNVFPAPATIVAAIDRLVRHATIFERNVASYRRRGATRTRAATSTGDIHGRHGGTRCADRATVRSRAGPPA